MIDSLVKDFDSLPKLWRNNLTDYIQMEESQVCTALMSIQFVWLTFF